ncbi:MAG: T9SS type A sorting domain-containing protein, partial [Rhodothermales bacterium]
HTDGLLWATTLMELYEEVTKDVNDRLNLASHSYLSPPTTFADAAEALIQADLDLYEGQHLGVIIDRLGARGLIDPAAFGPLVAHEPIRHVEQEGSTVTIEVDALSVSAPVASVSFFYSVNGGSFDVIQLDPQGNDRYTGSLTLPPEATEVAYYLEAADMSGLRTLLPAGAPQNTFTFGVGADTEAPLITHEPFEQVAIQAWPATVTAEVDDNQGVDSVWVSFVVDRPDGTRLTEGAFGLQNEQERYVGDFPVPVGELQENDKVRYRLHALDVARNPNEALLPAAGSPAFEFTMVVEGVLASFDFETDQALEAIGVWVRGIPNFGVQVAHSGQHVWATGVDVPYPATVHRSQLDLPPFNLEDLASYLIFWHWYDFEHSGVVEPGQATSGVLWDGGNVKVSINDGASWVVLEPMGGYSGALETGTGNPLQGERVFGGYSYGWRRAIVALPQADNLRIRFDFGTDGSNTLQAVSYAGWYLDDVRIVTELPQDVTPPTLVAAPPALMFADPGRLPPTLMAQVTDDVGVEAVLAEYEVVVASGARQQGTLRLDMSPTDLTTFLGVISTGEPFSVGDQIEYRLRLRDFDGNTTLFPAAAEAPLRIQYRLTESASVLRNVRASGLWKPLGQGWTVIPTDGPLEPRSGLVLDPLDLPDNAEEIAFTLTHSYRFGSDLGGNLKLSLDDGASWTVLAPVGGYGATYEPEAGHLMAGEQVFAGQVVNDVVVSFDLTEFAGQQVRLRVDFGTTRGLQAAEFWRISQASLAFSTLDQAFDIPRELALHPNFPDPFSDNTTISYTLPETMPVRLEMYNILGQRIAVLVDEEKPAGTYTFTLGRGGLASGVYLLRMIAGGTQHIERMVIAH